MGGGAWLGHVQELPVPPAPVHPVPKTSMSRICRLFVITLAALYAAAFALCLVGTSDWFGGPQGPLAGATPSAVSRHTFSVLVGTVGTKLRHR